MKNWPTILFVGVGLILLWRFLALFADQAQQVNRNQLLDAINSANKAAGDKIAADAAQAAKDAVDKAIADAKKAK